MICIPIGGIDPLEPLWELHIAQAIPTTVHHETQAFTKSERVVYIVITIQVEDERPI